MTRYGKLIGASLGPGDPELITRRAWAVLQSGARWLYPVKKAEDDSYALAIVARGGIAVPDDAEQLVFPMTRDAELLGKAWARAALRTVELLAEGRDLVFLVEGDASTFSTLVTWPASSANWHRRWSSRRSPASVRSPLPRRPPAAHWPRKMKRWR